MKKVKEMRPNRREKRKITSDICRNVSHKFKAQHGSAILAYLHCTLIWGLENSISGTILVIKATTFLYYTNIHSHLLKHFFYYFSLSVVAKRLMPDEDRFKNFMTSREHQLLELYDLVCDCGCAPGRVFMHM